jgi:hypothetical protein
MPTFAELNQQLQQLGERKAIIAHLIEYIDDTFLPKGGAGPKKTLLIFNSAVPCSAFEEFAANTLSAELEQIEHQIATINASPVGTAPPAPAAPPPAEQPVPETAPANRRRRSPRK